MNDRSPLARHQQAFLGALYDECIIDDTSLAARLCELGHPCDRSTLGRYRSGDRMAPLGLLWAILRHVGEQHSAKVLDLIARDFQLRVVPEADSDGSPVAVRDRLLDMQTSLGEASAAYRTALKDGSLDESERADLWAIVDGLAREAAGLRAALAPDAQRRPGRSIPSFHRMTDS